MDQNDRLAIEGLFDRLAQVERQSPPRDAEAERYIAAAITRQPAAPYLMAQTIVVQEHALNGALARIEELEAQLTAARQAGAQGGGLFGRLFGGGQPAARPRPAPQPQGGGFLAGAAQTAMGVAGGVLLGNAIAGMFADPAAAAEADPEGDEGFQDAGYDDDGGDW